MKCPSLAKPEQRDHSISPCLAGKRSAEEQADALGLSYSAVCRWLRKFREEGMPGLFPATDYPREPQTPEHVIVTLLFYKTCAPRASDRELARVLSAVTNSRIHNETVKALLERYPLLRYPNFQRLIQYQAPSDPQKLREEMVNLRQQGWTEKRIAQLLRCSRKTVMKWLRRDGQPEELRALIAYIAYVIHVIQHIECAEADPDRRSFVRLLPILRSFQIKLFRPA